MVNAARELPARHASSGCRGLPGVGLVSPHARARSAILYRGQARGRLLVSRHAARVHFGSELIAAGFADDVDLALEQDADVAVPSEATPTDTCSHFLGWTDRAEPLRSLTRIGRVAEPEPIAVRRL